MATIHPKGNLTADPRLRVTGSGEHVVTFTVAEDRRIMNHQTGQWFDAEPTFWRCQAWGRLADGIAAECRKGTPVLLEGAYITRSWVDEATGSKRSRGVLRVSELGVSVRTAAAATAS